jgi:hypothetical protein
VEIHSLLCIDGIPRRPTQLERGITAVKLTPKYTSAAGLVQYALRRGQTSTGHRQQNDIVSARLWTRFSLGSSKTLWLM